MPQPPYLDPLDDKPAHPPSTVTFTAHATDPQLSPIQYSLVNPPNLATINANSGVFQWTPQPSQVGAWTVTVRATATATGLIDQKSCAINVANQPPAFVAIADQNAHPGQLLAVPLQAPDPAGDPVTFTLIQGPGTITAGQYRFTPNCSQIGNVTVTIRATDSWGASVDQSFTVHVQNQPPTLDPIADQNAHPGQLLTVPLQVHDPDGDAVTLTVVSGPGSIIGQNFRWTPNWSQTGSFTVTIRASDPCGASVQRSFTVTVANQAPVLNALADVNVVHGNPVNFAAQANDADGDPLTWTPVGFPAGAMLTPNGAQAQFSWIPNVPNNYTITIRVADPGGLFDQKSCTITVT